jgi:hypothetical protein
MRLWDTLPIILMWRFAFALDTRFLLGNPTRSPAGDRPSNSKPFGASRASR